MWRYKMEWNKGKPKHALSEQERQEIVWYRQQNSKRQKIVYQTWKIPPSKREKTSSVDLADCYEGETHMYLS